MLQSAEIAERSPLSMPAASTEEPKNHADSTSEHSNTENSYPSNSMPMLPPFWNTAPDDFHAEEEQDVWKKINAASPSILRHQWLWAYFNLPALRLSDRLVGGATLVAETDGFRSYLHVTCSLLQQPHVENIKDVYFAKGHPALIFKDIQLGINLRDAGEAFERAQRLRDEQKLPSLIIVKNVPMLRVDSDGMLLPFGLVTIRKHVRLIDSSCRPPAEHHCNIWAQKAFRGIVSLALPNARSYNVYDMIDAVELGDCSGLFAISTWILDLRNFSAIRMLFRSELRNPRNEETDFLLLDALYAFEGMMGHGEADIANQDGFEFIERGYDLSTGSTVLPATSEGTQERGTPNSATEGDLLDEHDGTKLAEARSEAVHRTSSSMEPSSCPTSERQASSGRALSDHGSNSVDELAPRKIRADGAEPGGALTTQRRQLDVGVSEHFPDNTTHQAAITKGDSAETMVQGADLGVGTGKADCYAQNFVVRPSADISSNNGTPLELRATAASSEKGDGAEVSLCLSPDVNDVHTFGTHPDDQQASNSRLSANVSDATDDILRGALSGDYVEEGSNGVQPAEVNAGSAVPGTSLSEGHSKRPPVVADELLEQEMHSWLVGGDYHGEIPCGGFFVSTEDHACTSQEREYWVVEDVSLTVEQNYEGVEPGTLSVHCGDEVNLLFITNTYWAFCRTAEGDMGYIPTIAVPKAFSSLSDNSLTYGRQTAYVDRFCKWKETILYPGNSVVILADRGKWVLVRDYYRPFRQAYVPRFRIKSPWHRSLNAFFTQLYT